MWEKIVINTQKILFNEGNEEKERKKSIFKDNWKKNLKILSIIHI